MRRLDDIGAPSRRWGTVRNISEREDAVDLRHTPPLSLPADELRRLGYHVVDRIIDHLEQLDASPPMRPVDPDWSRDSVPPCPDAPTDPVEALDALFEEILPRGQRATHPRFFARIGSPSNPVSPLADFAAAGVNAFAASWAGGSGPSAVELAVLDWIRAWMGLPDHAEGVLVSGGSVGNLTAMAAAAHHRVAGARSRATAYTSEHAHASVARAWRILGFDPAHLRILVADAAGRLAAGAVHDAVDADRGQGLEPFCVVATAGTTSTGAVDELTELAALCGREQMWLHVDGAYGAPARLCAPGKAALAGIELADSLVLDAHKWLFQPYEVGCVLVRHPGALERAFALDGAYLRDTLGSGVDFRDRGLQLSRGSRALKLWLSLRVFGLDSFRAAIAHGISLAEHAESVLRRRDGWEVVSPAQLGIVCFRRVPDGTGADDIDRLNDELVKRAVADGYAAPSSTVLEGRTAIRMCTINPRTTFADVETTIERLERL
jgi:aromatic-L-amino-acid/L-tryptophan decarboxylase